MRLTLFKHESAETQQEPAEERSCIHGVRIPHWENPADMGHEDRASYFVCDSCGAHLSREESAAVDPAAIVAQADEEVLAR
jgi:hypothetical protein